MRGFPAVLFLLAGALATLQAEELDDLSIELWKILNESGVPSLSAIAIVDGEVKGAGAVGLRKKGGKKPVTIDDKYHIGSCTKSMTATLAAQLIEEGRIQWDSTVGDVLEKMEPGKAYADATLEQLLSNRGGFPKKVPPPIWSKAWDDYRNGEKRQRENFVKAMFQETPRYVPGTGDEYSNAGFTVAGAMLEEVTGTKWETLMEERIFKPLGMVSAGFGAPDEGGREKHPSGHTEEGKPVPSGPGDDNPSAIGPAGTVHCSLPDMAKYVRMHLLSETGVVLRNRESFERLHTSMDSRQGYGKGWGVSTRPWAKGMTLSHTGTNTMFFFVIWMAPERKFAAIAATNIGIEKGAKPCDDAVGAIIARYLK